MIEIDGPKTAWFEEGDGTKHFYTVYAIGSYENAGDLIQAYAKWRSEQTGAILVWRNRPEIEHATRTHDDTGQALAEPVSFWKIRWRCVIIPMKVFGVPTVPVKEEGAPVPFI